MKDTTPILQHFGLVVKELRREKLLSQEELANRCGLHRTYITDIEHGTRNVSLKNISKIARAVEVPLHDLFGRVERHSNNGVKVSDRLSRLQNIKRSPVEIVLVDDDQEYVELILHEMQKRNIGNTVHAVRSGEEA
ncbi:MAG: helix-turn-helix domain-containing protein, partial [Ignavibacteriales bacterium]|nr:helix-turn-helix domain-containing protein [Ignavibacteriales bacterium]